MACAASAGAETISISPGPEQTFVVPAGVTHIKVVAIGCGNEQEGSGKRENPQRPKANTLIVHTRNRHERYARIIEHDIHRLQ